MNTASARDPIMNIVSGQLAEIVAGDHPIEENGGPLWNLRIANVQHAEPLLQRQRQQLCSVEVAALMPST